MAEHESAAHEAALVAFLKWFREDGDDVVIEQLGDESLTVGMLRAVLNENARMREEQQAWYRRLRHAFRSGWDARGEVMAAAGGFMEAENRGQAYIAQLINMGALDLAPQQPAPNAADGAK